MYKESISKTSESFSKVGNINLNDVAAVFGNTSNQSVLADLKKCIVALIDLLKEEASYDDIMRAYDDVSKSIDTANLTGLIGQNEAADYYKYVDDIWASIEKEKVT